MTEKQSFTERFKEAILTKIEGKKDTESRIKALQKPMYPKTSAILTPTQLNAVIGMHWHAKEIPEMETLDSLAELIETCSISKDGIGREQMMKTYIAAETNVLPIGFAQPQQPEKKRKKKEEKESD